METKMSSIVGKFFLSTDDEGYVRWQGEVLSMPYEGYFMLQLYEWFMGYPSTKVLMPITAMAGWYFFETDEEMRYACDNNLVKQRS